MKRSEQLLQTLRQALRGDGWTNRKLAAHFGKGEATSKRWLSGQGLTLDRLEQLAELAGYSLAELTQKAERPKVGLAQELTLAQERALSEDEFLSFLFITILGGYSPGEVCQDFDVPPNVLETALTKLERLALIDRLGGGRTRPLIDREVIWRKSPMRTQFERRMKAQFTEMDFGAADATYASEVIKLSAQGVAMLAELIEKHRRDVQALAERDRIDSHLPRTWYAMLCAARPLDASGLRVGT